MKRFTQNTPFARLVDASLLEMWVRIQGVKLTTHLHLEQGLRMSGDKPQISL